jgi:O-antigen ligase
VPACLNAVLVLIEEGGLWMPFGEQRGFAHHLQCSALIGNPNEIGGYLGAATLGCVAAIASRRWSPRYAIVALLLASALIASQSLTAVTAFAAAGLAMLAMASWRRALAAAMAAIVIAALLIAFVAPLRKRAGNIVRWTRMGEYNALATERFTPFLAAWAMFEQHPLLGVGPGAFSWQYYDFKIAVEQRHPSLRRAYNRGVNFGEVHNDHLQVLAEGGVVGYAAFGMLLAALGALSFVARGDADDSRQRFVRQLALPLAVFWLVLSVAQFPLETTVVRSLLVHLAALCAGWRNR